MKIKDVNKIQTCPRFNDLSLTISPARIMLPEQVKGRCCAHCTGSGLQTPAFVWPCQFLSMFLSEPQPSTRTQRARAPGPWCHAAPASGWSQARGNDQTLLRAQGRGSAMGTCGEAPKRNREFQLLNRRYGLCHECDTRPLAWWKIWCLFS